MTMLRNAADDSGRSTATSVEAPAVERALDRILASQPFRTSKQCRDLLRYIVEHSLDGNDTSLRERVLGVEVFGRSAGYDTSDDPVVRLRAADVRKRLAQFYQSPDADPSLIHIELKPGSYRAAFSAEAAVHAIEDAPHPAQPIPPPAPPLPPPIHSVPHRRRRLFLLTAALLSFLLAAAAVLWRLHAGLPGQAQRNFWSPLTASGRPVLIYLGSNVAYILRPELLERYQHEHGNTYVGPEFFPDLPQNGSIRTDDLLPQVNTFITTGDMTASAQVVALLSRWGKPFQLRSAGDVSMGDLRSSPTVLIGGFNNRWTLEATNDLPFRFRDGTRIESRADPTHAWSAPPKAHGDDTEDFALVSRILHANTGGPVLAIGGIGSFGTQAAAEFVSSEDDMRRLLARAPAGWQDRNMQAVLRIKVVGYTPVAVDIVETAFW